MFVPLPTGGGTGTAQEGEGKYLSPVAGGEATNVGEGLDGGLGDKV